MVLFFFINKQLRDLAITLVYETSHTLNMRKQLLVIGFQSIVDIC